MRLRRRWRGVWWGQVEEGEGGGWIVTQWSWRAWRDEKKIFGLDGQEDVQQVYMPALAHRVWLTR